MNVPFEAGTGWVHIAHKNADLLLLVSIASLGLLPLVSIYIIETENNSAENPLASLSSSSSSSTIATMRSTPEVVRSCLRGLLYLAILFPYILALLSTYISIQLIRGQSLHEAGRTNKHSQRKGGAMFWPFAIKYTRVLKESDVVPEETIDPQENASNNWRVPSPGVQNKERDGNDRFLRTVSIDCAICMLQYQVGERIIWSSNPECIHCYHSSCLQAWMEPSQAQNRRCPCCRQTFFKY